MAAIFLEDKEQEIIKISFRSKGTFSVNQFARENFSGGGHDNRCWWKVRPFYGMLLLKNSVVFCLEIQSRTSRFI